MSQSVQNGFGSLVVRVKGKDENKNLSIYLKEEFCELCDIKKDDILEIEIKKIKRINNKR